MFSASSLYLQSMEKNTVFEYAHDHMEVQDQMLPALFIFQSWLPKNIWNATDSVLFNSGEIPVNDISFIRDFAEVEF